MKKIDENYAEYLFHRAIEVAEEYYQEAQKDQEEHPSDFNQGRVLGMFEILDTLKTRLEIAEEIEES